MNLAKAFKENYLLVVVFISGMTSMAVEMTASRLLAPFFGSSLFVWTNLIGVVLAALSVGYYFGGKLADKYQSEPLFYKIIFGAGLFFALIPFISRPIMLNAVQGIENLSLGLFYGSLMATLALFAFPLFLLGIVSPYAIRLRSKDVKTVGNVSGSIYSLSTIGSIIGTFIPTILSIPLIGTRKTIFVFAIILMAAAAIGMGKKHFAVLPALLVIPLFIITPIKPDANTIYETESIYNYIQITNEQNVRVLRLQEGLINSVYDPNNLLNDAYWHYYDVFPVLNSNTKKVAIVGLGAGTIAKEYEKYFPEIKIDGVEIDNRIVSLSKEHFALPSKNLVVHKTDGRTFFYNNLNIYDLIIVDAYKEFYIPFHLTTNEFFQLAKSHLNKNGISSINIGLTNENSDIFKMLANTVKANFNYVYVVSVDGTSNFILIASDHKVDFDILKNYKGIGRVEGVSKRVLRNLKEVKFYVNTLVLTDDLAPVEVFTDYAIYKSLVGKE